MSIGRWPPGPPKIIAALHLGKANTPRHPRLLSASYTTFVMRLSVFLLYTESACAMLGSVFARSVTGAAAATAASKANPFECCRRSSA